MKRKEKELLVCLIAAIIDDRNSWRDEMPISPHDLLTMCEMSDYGLREILEALIWAPPPQASLSPPAAPQLGPSNPPLVQFGTWLDVLKWIEDHSYVYYRDPEYGFITERRCDRLINNPTQVFIHASARDGLLHKTVDRGDLNSFYRKAHD